MRPLELDALQLEDEEEGTSYLADLSKVPDFVDEPPVEVADVSLHVYSVCHFPLETDTKNSQTPSKEAVKTSA